MGFRDRRLALIDLVGASAGLLTHGALAQTPTSTTLSVPGPRNSVSLPLELAHLKGLDRQAGLLLRLSFVGGGAVAIQELRDGNAEFAVFGLPAMVRANLVGGRQMVALAALDGLPLYTLMVRADLRDAIRSVRDLAGRTVGVHSNSLQVQTTSYQLVTQVLRRNGVDLRGVKILAAGQSWETQSAMLVSRSIDASMCDEPFATRMELEGLAFKLFATGDPADAASVPGAGFLRAVLIGLRDRVEAAPERAERAVRLIQHTLAWIGSHSDEELADALNMQGNERTSTLAVARAYPLQYSRDGRFSRRQLAETDLFFRAGNEDLPAAMRTSVADMLIDRWAGTKP